MAGRKVRGRLKSLSHTGHKPKHHTTAELEAKQWAKDHIKQTSVFAPAIKSIRGRRERKNKEQKEAVDAMVDAFKRAGGVMPDETEKSSS